MATDTAAPPRPDPTRPGTSGRCPLSSAAAFVSAWQGWLPLGTPDPAADFARDLAALRTAYEKVTPDRDELKDLLARVAAGVDAFPEQAPSPASPSAAATPASRNSRPPRTRPARNWALAKQHFELVSAEQLQRPGDDPRLAFRSAKARVGRRAAAERHAADISCT